MDERLQGWWAPGQGGEAAPSCCAGPYSELATPNDRPRRQLLSRASSADWPRLRSLPTAARRARRHGVGHEARATACQQLSGVLIALRWASGPHRRHCRAGSPRCQRAGRQCGGLEGGVSAVASSDGRSRAQISRAPEARASVLTWLSIWLGDNTNTGVDPLLREIDFESTERSQCGERKVPAALLLHRVETPNEH